MKGIWSMNVWVNVSGLKGAHRLTTVDSKQLFTVLVTSSVNTSINRRHHWSGVGHNPRIVAHYLLIIDTL